MLEAQNKYESTLHKRFVFRVLAPPFITLLILSVVVLWQLGHVLHSRVINDLQLSAATLANTLEREFTLRETALRQTGGELFIIKSEYIASRQSLDVNRDACRAYMIQKRTYLGSPNNSCDPFLSSLAISGANLAVLEDAYIKQGEELIRTQNQRINDRLSAFKQFFPEVLALVVIDDQGLPVSSALSGVFKGSTEPFQSDAMAALKAPIRGKQVSVDGYGLAIFATPISGGSVLAAYDVQNENFIRRVWSSAPIDASRSLAVLVDNSGSPAYPVLKDPVAFQGALSALEGRPFFETSIDGIAHTVVWAIAGDSGWRAAIATPSAALRAPLRDAQLVGVLFVGLFIVGFVWVGAVFVQRTLQNIATLVSGAIVFGAGKLDYRIALDHADGEFLRLADTMNAMAERISAAEKAIDEKNKEFISVATHELRAPLTSVIGFLSMFKEGNDHRLNTASRDLIDQAYFNTVRLRDLVNDMLNVARLESGRSELSLEPAPIKDVVDDVVSSMSVVAKIANVNLTYRPAHAGRVVADVQRLRIIVNNFVSNAIKYNKPGGNVTVSHAIQDDMLITSIADDGLGIPLEQQEHMFEKFFRVTHDDRKTVTGTGLGMFITKQYIDGMHGKIWFESTHGKGTTFYFGLPIAKVANKGQPKELRRKPKKHQT